MMGEWFECKVTYQKEVGDGKTKKVTEAYLVDAMNFTDAEKRIIEEMQPFMSGEFTVSDIKRVKYAELFEDDRESADKWFKVKINIITLDEKSGAEKKTPQNILLQSSTFTEAIKTLNERMNADGSTLEYTIASANETTIMDVFHYAEARPEV